MVPDPRSAVLSPRIEAEELRERGLGDLAPAEQAQGGRREDQRGEQAGRAVMELVRKDIRPSQILTRRAIDNAIAAVAATGGSTNGVLHLLAIARELGVPLSIDDFDTILERTPLLADLKPWGTYVATDWYEAGGMSLVSRELLKRDLIDGDALTVDGRTLAAVAEDVRETPGQQVVVPIEQPLKPRGGIAVRIVQELGLPLRYHFEPGSPDDGVTVQVPVAVLPQLDPAPFTWQVPGVREELVTALLRSLPVAAFAGIGIGMLQSMALYWDSVARYSQAVPFVVITIAMVWWRRTDVWAEAR